MSCQPRDAANAQLQEEARKLGLEPRFVYRVTQVRVGSGYRLPGTPGSRPGPGQADSQDKELLRLQEPPGRSAVGTIISSCPTQWVGSWSPESTTWTNVPEATRRELDGEAFHDGGFWIGFQDFLKYFDTIDFCHINTEADKEVVFNGRWEVG